MVNPLNINMEEKRGKRAFVVSFELVLGKLEPFDDIVPRIELVA